MRDDLGGELDGDLGGVGSVGDGVLEGGIQLVSIALDRIAELDVDGYPVALDGDILDCFGSEQICSQIRIDIAG